MQHASPGAAYSKTAYRGWYSDKRMSEDEDLINGNCDVIQNYDFFDIKIL